MRRRTALSIAGACAASLALAPAALATFPGENGKIAFSRDGDIWTINPDGTGEKRLTSGAHIDGAPEWSPDGRQLLFERRPPDFGQPHIYRVAADGAGLTWVRQGGSPQFAPDGKRIAYGAEDVYVDRRDGSEPQRITHLDLGHAPADWSPINDLILFQAHNNISWIGAVSPAGATLDFGLPSRDPGPDYVDYRDPSWSPDGTRVVLGSLASAEHSYCWSVPTCSDPLVGLIVTDLAGGYTVIRQGQALGHTTAWSPDGTRIAYTAGDSLQIIHPDGSGRRTLTKGSQPDWQPLPRPPIHGDAPPPPEPRTVTVTVPVEVPGPVRVVEKIVTRTVQGGPEKCVVPKGKRRFTLLLRANKTIRAGMGFKVVVDLDKGRRGKATVAKGKKVGLKAGVRR